MTTLRILIADDDPFVCAHLATELGKVADFEVAGTARDGAEAVDLALTTRPDVILMDIRMPDIDGVQATAALARQADGPAVLLMTTVDSDQALVSGLRAGAKGYALKTSPVALISDALRAVARGADVLSPEATIRLLRLAESQRPAVRDPRLDALPEREGAVLRMLGEGRSNAEISAALYLAESTVKGHVSRLMDKLDCANRTQLALLAQQLS